MFEGTLIEVLNHLQTRGIVTIDLHVDAPINARFRTEPKPWEPNLWEIGAFLGGDWEHVGHARTRVA